MKILFSLIILLYMISAVTLSSRADADPSGSANSHGPDPLNATYLIDGRAYQLTERRCETAPLPDSATRISTTALGKPVYADLTGDGRKDAAVLLVHDPGGSGTFFYVAAAVNVDNRYQGTNAVLLGDRIEPRRIRIGNGVVTVRFEDRGPEEAMSATPTVDRFMMLALNDHKLEALTLKIPGEQIMEGWVTIGHEARSFEPCGGRQALWMMGDSAVLKQIMAAYRKALPGGAPYRKLIMILGGETVAGPSVGFGSEYPAAFKATRIVRVVPEGNCTGDEYIFHASEKNG